MCQPCLKCELSSRLASSCIAFLRTGQWQARKMAWCEGSELRLVVSCSLLQSVGGKVLLEE
jgi:hypothetical protein